MTKYDYDSYDRVSVIHRYPNGLGQAEDVCQRAAYSYDGYTDPISGFSSQNASGHVAAVVMGDPTACTASTGVPQQFREMFSYNAAGHTTTKRLELYQANGAPGSPGNYVGQWWDVGYSYNAFGQVASTSYPGSGGSTQNGSTVAGQTYTVSYDSMDRPGQLKDSRSGSLFTVSGVQYNEADQPTQTQFAIPGGNLWENRGYNHLNQVTVLNNFNTTGNPATPNGPVNLTYTYADGNNNGQITGGTLSGGNTVTTFAYDVLKRLTAASSTVGGTPQWSQTYAYDGFGNLTSKSGSGLNFTNPIDLTTNRLAFNNFCYDSNGNLLSYQTGSSCISPDFTYDVANRMVSAKVSGGTEHYVYDADNKRISTIAASGAQTVFIYGAGGEKLSIQSSSIAVFSGGTISNNVYFAGRLIKQGTDLISAGNDAGQDTNFVAVDRLGSVKKPYNGGGTAYMPYGEEVNASGTDQIKFATYTRDSSTGLDYADQRFYTSQFGRFMSADRFKRAAKKNSSGSWNKYSYVQNDPVNMKDPSGRYECWPDEDCFPDPDDPGPEPDPGDPGGPVYSVPVNVVTDSQMRSLLSQKFANFSGNHSFSGSHCDWVFSQVIEGYSTLGFENKANSTEFYNGTDPVQSILTENQVWGNNSSTTLGEYYQTGLKNLHAPDATTMVNGTKSAVVLWANFFRLSMADQENVLVHELLHAYTGWDDRDIFDAFANYGLSSGPTGNISNWIGTDCKSTP